MPKEATTQQLVDVSEIKGDVVVLKNGSLRAIIEVSAINFELRSEDEQVALLQNFQQFLNSVDFPVQITISSRQMQIDDYLKYVEEQATELDELLKIQSSEYARFVKELSGLANIMSKKFYITIPFFIYENPQKVGLRQSIGGLFKATQTTGKITDEQFGTYRNQILQRAELVFDSLVSLGLKTRMLKGDELIKVLYGFYNPGSNISLPNKDQS